MSSQVTGPQAFAQVTELKKFYSNFNPAEKFGPWYANALYAEIPHDLTVIRPQAKSDEQEAAGVLIVAEHVVGVATAKLEMIATVTGNHGLNFDELNTEVSYGNNIIVLADHTGKKYVFDLKKAYDANDAVVPLRENDKDGGDKKASYLSGRMMLLIGVIAAGALLLGAHKKGLLPFGKTVV